METAECVLVFSRIGVGAARFRPGNAMDDLQQEVDGALSRFEQALAQVEQAFADLSRARGSARRLEEENERLRQELEALRQRATTLADVNRKALERMKGAIGHIRQVLKEN